MAYEALEVATVLFLRKFGPTLLARAGSTAAALPMLGKIAALLPAHTRRSEEMQNFQQFSTPIPLGVAAVAAAALRPGDRVLEPSAGTGLLAILAEISGASLTLNEFAETRAGLLRQLFPGVAVTRCDAAQIDDHLAREVRPTVVLMNPPFSVLANVQGRRSDATPRHIASALARLEPGGRLVAITGAGFAPDAPAWAETFARLQESGRIVFSAALDGAVFAKHGTSFETRLTVIDKLAADDPAQFPESPGVAPDVATLIGWIEAHVPPRAPAVTTPPTGGTAAARSTLLARQLATSRPQPKLATAAFAEPEGVELAYATIDAAPPDATRLTDAIYETYGLQSIRIEGAKPHPTKLVQSAAMASVASSGRNGRGSLKRTPAA